MISAFGVEHGVFAKKYDWKHPENNRRGQNAAAAAAVGAPVGAAVGAHKSRTFNTKHHQIDLLEDEFSGRSPRRAGRTATTLGRRAPRTVAAGIRSADAVRHHGAWTAAGALYLGGVSAASAATGPARKKPRRPAPTRTR